MAHLLQLGRTPIQVADNEFALGLQTGYLHYVTDFQDKPITESLLYTVIMQNIISTSHTDRRNTGYLVGFLLALFTTDLTTPRLRLVATSQEQEGSHV